MYAVIRAGGKQYRVAPGDVIKIETTPASNGTVEFGDVLAVSGSEGQVGLPKEPARVVGTVVEEGRHDKVLVFHYKRKKQYKKLRGHRQNFTAVRITEIAFDGQSFKAPELPVRQPKPKKAEAAETHAHEGHEHEGHAHEAHAKAKPHAKHAAAKKGAKPKAAAKKKASGRSASKKSSKKK
jgi:large subunit ribosomal protein L21